MTIKSTLKRMPGLVRADQALHDGLQSLLRRRAARDVERLRTPALFGPYSSGDWSARAHPATLGAQQVFPFPLELLQTVGAAPPRPAVDAGAFRDTEPARAAAAQLAERSLRHGSGKASSHNDHLIDGKALEHPGRIVRMLEVGLGTNNEDVASHMGRGGRPGAPLRAFRDFLPRAEIVEDIAPAARPFWNLVDHLMPRPGDACQLIEARGGLVFPIRRA